MGPRRTLQQCQDMSLMLMEIELILRVVRILCHFKNHISASKIQSSAQKALPKKLKGPFPRNWTIKNYTNPKKIFDCLLTLSRHGVVTKTVPKKCPKMNPALMVHGINERKKQKQWFHIVSAKNCNNEKKIEKREMTMRDFNACSFNHSNQKATFPVNCPCTGQIGLVALLLV